MLTALGLLAVVLLIAANGYFVAAEFAYVAARRQKLAEGADEGDRKSRTALAVHKRLSFMLSGAQLGITVTSLVLLVLTALALSFACAQEVRLELGFGGEIITGRWNPLRLTTRDLPEAELVLALDQSTLREGEKLAVYRFPVGTSGLGVFEDEIVHFYCTGED